MGWNTQESYIVVWHSVPNTFVFNCSYLPSPSEMTETKTPLSLPPLFVLFFIASTFTTPSTSSIESFVYGGCSQVKYTPGSTYESNINSLLTSIVNSATFTSYNNFTFPGPSAQDTAYGLFQCRGDISNTDCARCVAHAVSQIGTICLDACGAALQLDGCFIKYDNATFLGVEDKTVVMRKCGPSIGYDSDSLARRDAAIGYLAAADGGYKPFRVAGAGNIQGLAQCVGDLSPGECQDCLSEAIGRLRTECGASMWGDMFFAKCYARFTQGGYRPHGGGGNDSRNDDVEIEKTLAVIIGLIAGVAFVVVFLSFLSHYYEKRKGGK